MNNMGIKTIIDLHRPTELKEDELFHRDDVFVSEEE